MQQKGVLLKGLLLAIEKVYGEAGLAQVKGALPADVRAVVDQRILPVNWYPVRVAAEVQTAIKVTVGKGTWDASHRLGLEAALTDFRGVYKALFLRAVQYEAIWARFEKAWSAYNSQGSIKWTDKSPGHACGVIAGVAGFNAGMWYGVAGRAEGIMMVGGARSVATQVHEPTGSSARIDVLWFD